MCLPFIVARKPISNDSNSCQQHGVPVSPEEVIVHSLAAVGHVKEGWLLGNVFAHL